MVSRSFFTAWMRVCWWDEMGWEDVVVGRGGGGGRGKSRTYFSFGFRVVLLGF
jgi:hypothetical protein